MRTIAILAQKGGSGKSTLAQCLAVAAEIDGKTAVILDMDPQVSAAAWKKRRGADDPAVLTVTSGTLNDELERIRGLGADLAIIDTPARLSDWAMDAARVADLVIVPAQPTVKDLERVEPSIKLATVYEVRPVFVVLNKTRPRGEGDNADAEQFIRTKNYPVAPVRIGDRVVHVRADTLGRTPLETEPDSKAADEIKQLYRYTTQLLNQLTTKEENHGKQETKLHRRAV